MGAAPSLCGYCVELRSGGRWGTQLSVVFLGADLRISHAPRGDRTQPPNAWLCVLKPGKKAGDLRRWNQGPGALICSRFFKACERPRSALFGAWASRLSPFEAIRP